MHFSQFPKCIYDQQIYKNMYIIVFKMHSYAVLCSVHYNTYIHICTPKYILYTSPNLLLLIENKVH